MAKRALTANDLTELVMYSDPQLTPDGDTYFFVETVMDKEKDEYRSHLFTQKVNSSADEKQWTYGKQKDSHPRISPDGKQVVFQSDRSGVSQLWLMPADGGEAKQLTTFQYGAYSPEWSKDGKYLFFSAPLEKGDNVQHQKELTREERQKQKEEKSKQPMVIDRLNYKSDHSGFLDDKRMQIIMYDLQEDTYTQLTSDDSDHHFQDVSPDGKTVLFAGNISEDADYELITDLYTVDISSKEIKKLTNGSGSFYSAIFSPNGDKVAYVGNEQQFAGATQDELFVFDLATKERSCLTEGWDVQLGDPTVGDFQMGEFQTGPVWSADGEKLFFIAAQNGATALYSVALDHTRTALYAANNHVAGFAYNKTDQSFVLTVITPTDPVNFYHLTANGNARKLTNANAAFLEEVALCEPEEINFKAKDGWDIQGWLLKPYGFEADKKYPLVLEVHGGPHTMYGNTFFHEMQLLAAKGYVVLYVNPRGSYGYGQKFVDACRKDYGGSDYTDLMAAVDYALQTYDFIDQNRLGVTGGSYGGFMTNWIVGHTNRFKAAVTQRSISNWLSFYGVSDIGYFFTKWEHGLHLMDDPKALWDISPLKYAENVETPLLILHGERDFRCPIEQGEQFYVTLKHLKKDVAFVRFPNATHELSRSGAPKMRLERLHHICRWFEKYLGC